MVLEIIYLQKKSEPEVARANESIKPQTRKIDVEKQLFQRESQDCEEETTLTNKDIKNVEEGASGALKNENSPNGIPKFFYFYQGLYLIMLFLVY